MQKCINIYYSNLSFSFKVNTNSFNSRYFHIYLYSTTWMTAFFFFENSATFAQAVSPSYTDSTLSTYVRYEVVLVGQIVSSSCVWRLCTNNNALIQNENIYFFRFSIIVFFFVDILVVPRCEKLCAGPDSDRYLGRRSFSLTLITKFEVSDLVLQQIQIQVGSNDKSLVFNWLNHFSAYVQCAIHRYFNSSYTVLMVGYYWIVL